MDRRRAALGWLALALVAALWLQFLRSLPASYAVGLNDFPAYRSAGRHVLEGEPERLYGTEKDFTNLPVVALLMAPLWKLSYQTAWRLFWWLEVTSYVAAFALLLGALARFYPPLSPGRAALAGLVYLSFAPVLHRCLLLGQTTPMLVLLLAGSYVLARGGRPRAAGGLLGLVCLVKVPPLLLPAIFLLRRRLALALSALAVVVAGVALSWLLYGGEILGQYAQTVIWDNLGRSTGAFNNRSLEGAFTRLLSEASLVDWVPRPRPARVTLALALSAAGLLALLFRASRPLLWPAEPPRDDDPRRGSLELELAVGVALMLLLFPIVWIHYYLFLAVPLTLLPFWWLQRELPRRAWLVLGFAAGLALAVGTRTWSNEYYGAHDHEWAMRLALNGQTLGALLLALGCAVPLAELARRERRADPEADSRIQSVTR